MRKRKPINIALDYLLFTELAYENDVKRLLQKN